GVVLFHCAGGKDRTGLIAALLLRLAGASRDDIGEDYAVSEANLAPIVTGLISQIEDDVQRRRSEKLARTPAAAMVRVLGAADEAAEDAPRDVEIEVVSVPLFGEGRAGSFAEKYDGYLDGVRDPVDWYRWAYREALAEFRPRFARAVSAIATAPGTAVVHCAGGKDRTGLVCALVLRLAGVPA